MDRTDVIKLFGIIKSAYENFCFNLSKLELALKIDTWHTNLKDIRYDTALAAIEKHIKFETRVPVIADIINFKIESNRMSGSEALNIYLKNITLYSKSDDYEKFKNDYPDIYEVSKLIGHKTILMGNYDFIKSSFVRVFDKYQVEKSKNSMISDMLKSEISKVQYEVNNNLLEEWSY